MFISSNAKLMARDRDRWRALINTVMKLRIP